jgi:transcriptional regulator with XRE-family HTH domain
MAQRLGVAKSWISEIENGHKEPTLSLLDKYAEALNIPVSSILFFSEQLENTGAAERARVLISKKVLALLDFITENSGGDEDGEPDDKDVSA